MYHCDSCKHAEAPVNAEPCGLCLRGLSDGFTPRFAAGGGLGASPEALRSELAELRQLRSLVAALDCAVPEYVGDPSQQLGCLIARADGFRPAGPEAETIRPPARLP